MGLFNTCRLGRINHISIYFSSSFCSKGIFFLFICVDIIYWRAVPVYFRCPLVLVFLVACANICLITSHSQRGVHWNWLCCENLKGWFAISSSANACLASWRKGKETEKKMRKKKLKTNLKVTKEKPFWSHGQPSLGADGNINEMRWVLLPWMAWRGSSIEPDYKRNEIIS